MSKLPSILTNPFKSQRQPTTPSQFYSYKTRFSMLGTVASGKTTVCGLIVLAAQTLSSDRPDFKCRVLEGTSSILDATSKLREGRFPSKTQAYHIYAMESGLLLREQRRFRREKRIHIPICDIAGEDIQTMIKGYKHLGSIGQTAYSAAMNLVNYVKDSDGFILTVPASKALGVKGFPNPEKESDKIHFDPDVNLHRILSAILTHKEQSKGRPIKAIAVIITKWDLLRPYAENIGMNIYEPSGQGLKEFMDTCFPATSMILKDYGLDNVQFFPSYVDLEYDLKGQPRRWLDGDQGFKIVTNKRVPSCDLQSYVNLIEYLLTFAT